MSHPRKSPDALRTIGEVAEDLDVATHVLRFWESKFPQISPQKRRGRRYYRPEDIHTLKEIKSLLYDKGLTIKGAQTYFNSRKSMPAANEDTLFDPFNRDLFGNVVPPKYDNMDEQAESISRLNQQDLQQLKDVLQGLQTLKNRLHQTEQ